ncbi:MAG: bifunctional metallophosphatase/5'-nucleotidase [Eubacteriaceae bacterium]|jgi:2',3'-cyclic-nucleotide 2'-phosphodiesterase (5'-nucleotidase family)|nr:bifunctional metallophosphatase/5'-nucleotidase [Eubacteriaceae bacterium]
MTKKIGIVQMNDTHANLLPHDDVRYTGAGFQIETMGGYPRIMTKINEYREKHGDNLLVFDNGDTLHGTYEAVISKGEVMIPYLRELGVDAMTFHWDSAYTPRHLKSLEEKLGYPILAANVYHEGTEDHFFQSTEIFFVDGVKFGVIGVASNIIKKNMPEPFWKGAEFTNGIHESRHFVKKLKDEGVDVIILLSHLGYPQDIELLNRVDGIDICLSGHTHNRIREIEKVNDSYIIQSGSLASSMGYLELVIDQGQIKRINHEYIILDHTVKEDAKMLEMLADDAILNQHKAYLETVVGESLVDLHRASSFYGTMDYLLLDSMRHATGLDIAFSNGWRYGGAIQKGKLTRRDLYYIVPMDPPIMTAEMIGEEIVQMLEENLEATFSKEPFKQMGGYIKRNSGLKVYFKLENPYGHRIQYVFVGQEELDYKKTYQVAYVTRQSVPERFGQNHRAFGKNAIEAMEELLKISSYNREDTGNYIPI